MVICLNWLRVHDVTIHWASVGSAASAMIHLGLCWHARYFNHILRVWPNARPRPRSLVFLKIIYATNSLYSFQYFLSFRWWNKETKQGDLSPCHIFVLVGWKAPKVHVFHFLNEGTFPRYFGTYSTGRPAFSRPAPQVKEKTLGTRLMTYRNWNWD